MTYFIRAGASYNLASDKSLDIHDLLPVGTYTVNYDQMREAYYLDVVDDFQVNGKIYGDTDKLTEKIFATFQDRDNSTGVMLVGEKGSGKTLQAKKLSLKALDAGMPTIIINQAWHGEQFNLFMQNIEQPTVVLFDEFEKTYQDNVKQEALLTLFDGVYPSKKLFILTCNDSYRVNDHLKNRPGRIYYNKSYSGLEREFIEEYCEDNLKNKDHIESICRIATAFSEFNFDILKAMVEEMNRWGETPQEVMGLLNARPELSDSATYDSVLSIAGKEEIPGAWRGVPLSQSGITIYYPSSAPSIYYPSSAPSFEDEFGDGDEGRAYFSLADLKGVDMATGSFHFENKIGTKLRLTKRQVVTYNSLAL